MRCRLIRRGGMIGSGGLWSCKNLILFRTPHIHPYGCHMEEYDSLCISIQSHSSLILPYGITTYLRRYIYGKRPSVVYISYTFASR